MSTAGHKVRPVLYTIGHSNHSAMHFMDLLQLHQVQMVADVRSRPYSKRHPQYSRDALRAELGRQGIPYFFLGKELGGKPEDSRFVGADGKPDYARMAGAASFQEGLDQLRSLMREGRTALVCAEEDPSRCHRRHLIARVLFEEGVEIRHIRGDGSVETEESIRSREAAGAEDQLLLFN